jgi:2-polyprenyl-6-methoxyphenol hydroxylase-like FAD-dependent oxidoreductase
MRSVNLTTGREAARVLIVGAGPTGLMLALCLKQYGLAFDIVDAKSGPSVDSKALAINPMSQLQFAMFFGDELLGKDAVKVNNLNINWSNTHRINRIDLSRLHSQYPSMLVQTQFNTESELLAHACQRGIDVQWNTQVHAVEELHQEVAVSTIHSDGTSTEKFYDYVIGCDGKRSLVRAAMNTVMEHKSYEMFLALADYELETTLDEKSAHYIIYDDIFFVLVPLGKKKWRIVVKHTGVPDKSKGIELIEEPVRRYFGDQLMLGKHLWFSQAPLYVSYAEKLSTNRLFIAGDAAHLFSPIGGTGMNSGFLDALNLGWKLAYEILGYSKGNRLTTSYNEERPPEIKANASATDRLTQLISRVARSEKDVAIFLPNMKNRHLMRSVLPTNIAGTALSYKASSVIENSANVELGHLDERFAELVCVHARNHKNRAPLIRLFYCVSQKIEDSKVELILPQKSGLLPVVVKFHCEDNATIYCKNDSLCIPKQEWSKLFGQYSLIAVRPDGVIVFKGDIGDYSTMITQYFNYLTAA